MQVEHPTTGEFRLGPSEIAERCPVGVHVGEVDDRPALIPEWTNADDRIEHGLQHGVRLPFGEVERPRLALRPVDESLGKFVPRAAYTTRSAHPLIVRPSGQVRQGRKSLP
jgi:hypothetical protein